MSQVWRSRGKSIAEYERKCREQEPSVVEYTKRWKAK